MWTLLTNLLRYRDMITANPTKDKHIDDGCSDKKLIIKISNIFIKRTLKN